VDVLPYSDASAYDVLWSEVVVVEEPALTGEPAQPFVRAFVPVPKAAAGVREPRPKKAAVKKAAAKAAKAEKKATRRVAQKPAAEKKAPKAKAAKKPAAKKPAPKKKGGK
jgi:hypothetical protein